MVPAFTLSSMWDTVTPSSLAQKVARLQQPRPDSKLSRDCDLEAMVFSLGVGLMQHGSVFCLTFFNALCSLEDEILTLPCVSVGWSLTILGNDLLMSRNRL